MNDSDHAVTTGQAPIPPALRQVRPKRRSPPAGKFEMASSKAYVNAMDRRTVRAPRVAGGPLRQTKPIWGVLGAEMDRRGVDAGRFAGAPVAPNATNLGAFSPKDDTRPEARKTPTEKAYLYTRIWCVRQTLRVAGAPAAPNEANVRQDKVGKGGCL